MPNLITWAAKQRYSDYGEIPDDDLTLRYAEAHPQYLSDPEFKADYDRIMRSKQAAVPQAAPEPEAGVMESVARRAYGGLNVLGGGLWKGGEYVSRAVGADETAEEARLNYEYAKAEADAQRAKSAQSGIGKYAGMVAEAIPSILPAIAVAPAGLAAMAASSGLSGAASTLGTAEDAYKLRYLKEGFSEAEATEKARRAALLPAAASGVATGLITRGFGAKGVESLAAQAVTREAAKKLITQSLPKAFAKGAVSEGAEEAVDQLAQAAIERMSYNPDLTLAQAVEQMKDAFIVGGALGGGVSGLRHPGEVRQAQAIVAQERAEKAAVAAEKADRESRIEAAVAAAREQKRVSEMTPQERLLEEQDRIAAEYEPIRLAQHEIDDRIRAEAVAKYKAARRTEIESGITQAIREEYEAALGIPSVGEQEAALADLEAEAETRARVVADKEKGEGIRRAVVRYGQEGRKIELPESKGQQQWISAEEASQRLAQAAGVSAPPLPFLSQPIIQIESPRNVKQVTGGKLGVKEAEFPAGRQIEGQPRPKPYKPDVGIQQAILEETGFRATPRPTREVLPAANLPTTTQLQTKAQALAAVRAEAAEAEANRLAQARHEAEQAEWNKQRDIESAHAAENQRLESEGEPPVQFGYKRLYRTAAPRQKGMARNAPEWVTSEPDFAGIKGTGKHWFTSSKQEATVLSNVPGEPVLFVDVPDSDAKRYDATLIPVVSKNRNKAPLAGESYLIPIKFSKLEKPVPPRPEHAPVAKRKAAKRKPSSAKSLGEDARAVPSGDHAMIKTVAKDAAPDESVDVVYDPALTVEGRIVEGYVDDSGRIVLNSAAPRISDPAHVRMVVREERAHKLLNSQEGKDALNKFVGKLTPSEKANLQSEGYVQDQGETAGEYDVRLHNEFIAKQARENTTQWRQIVDRVRGWLSQFGLKLSNAEVARAILRKLNDSRASSYSISGRKAGLTAKLKSEWIAQYSMVDGLQELLAAFAGSKVTFRLSKMFERVAGATGEAEARSKELHLAIDDKIVGRVDEFNQLASLNAALSRLLDAEGWRQKAAQLKAGKQSAETSIRIKKFEERADRIGAVRHNGELMTIPNTQKLIADITARLKSDGSWAQVQEALVIYKTFMDADADLKYKSGLISESKWNHFKRADRFYMPYINMSVREDAPAYSGLKGRVGQTSAEDKYKTALEAADHLFLSSYRHAAMNKAKLQLKKMAEYANAPHLAQVVNETAASDNVISGLQDGKPFYIKTDADTVAAVNFYPNASNALIDAASKFSSVQRFGATTASASFQLLNLVFSDIPNLALMSKAGVRDIPTALSFMGSIWDGFQTAYGGNFGEPSKAYLDYLKSGAAGGSLQSQIDSATSDRAKGGISDVADFIGKFARTFEETTKIAGYKRLLKDAGVDSVSKLSVSDATNLIAEVRNFSGSPDFAVSGSLVNSAKLSTWLIFVPAALRGNATTISRLLDTTRSGRTEYERGAARGALIKAGFFIGAATYAAYALNNLTDEMREDYDRIPEDEKRNNFMIPLDSYFTAADGSQVREFARIPKRGVVKILANTIEDSMEYFRKTDSEHFGKMLTGAVESIVPLDISGKTPKERFSGAFSSVNPIFKVPLEYATGHNFFRRSRIIPRRLERAETSEQYTERTNDNVKVIATAIGMSPLDLRNALDGMTGGMTAGLLPEKVAAGDRGGISGVPVLSRFVRSARQESQDEGFITELQEKQATASVKRFREADTFVKERKDIPIRESYEEAVRRYGPENRDIVEKVRELLQKRERGITVEDDRVLQLSPPQRAEYILKQYARTPEQGRKEYILSLSKKHILTPDTRREMFRRGFRWD